jgi:predicted ester cyclase
MFNAHKPDRAADYVSPEVKWHGGTLGTVEGRENVLGLLRGFIGALPDLHATEQDMVAEGDTVAVRFTIAATQEAQQQHFQIVEQRQRRVSARTRHESVTTNKEELSYGMGD